MCKLVLSVAQVEWSKFRFNSFLSQDEDLGAEGGHTQVVFLVVFCGRASLHFWPERSRRVRREGAVGADVAVAVVVFCDMCLQLRGFQMDCGTQPW